jgi:hypothetical protein
MPRFDGTGPRGFGSGTGRGFGPCCGGAGWGYGQGRGLGWRRFYSKNEETDMLKDDVKELEQELKAAKERLAELEGK